MKRLKQIFDKVENLNIYLRPYEIIVTSSTSGFLEHINDTSSIDYIKRKFPKKEWTLSNFFDSYFGEEIDVA